MSETPHTGGGDRESSLLFNRRGLCRRSEFAGRTLRPFGKDSSRDRFR